MINKLQGFGGGKGGGGYGAPPAQSYGAPTQQPPAYNAPAVQQPPPSYSAPAPQVSIQQPPPSYNNNGRPATNNINTISNNNINSISSGNGISISNGNSIQQVSNNNFRPSNSDSYGSPVTSVIRKQPNFNIMNISIGIRSEVRDFFVFYKYSWKSIEKLVFVSTIIWYLDEVN